MSKNSKRNAKSEENTRGRIEISRWVSVRATLAGNGTRWQGSFVARERYCLFTVSAGNGVSRRPREPGRRLPVAVSSSSSATGFPRYYPAEITFLPVVATSSFVPYLGDPPRKSSKSHETTRTRKKTMDLWMELAEPPEANRRSTVTRSSNPWPD